MVWPENATSSTHQRVGSPSGLLNLLTPGLAHKSPYYRSSCWSATADKRAEFAAMCDRLSQQSGVSEKEGRRTAQGVIGKILPESLSRNRIIYINTFAVPLSRETSALTESRACVNATLFTVVYDAFKLRRSIFMINRFSLICLPNRPTLPNIVGRSIGNRMARLAMFSQS